MFLAIMLAFLLLAPFVRFEVNDDIQMLTTASGATTDGTGMPQLMFMSSVLGNLLVLLYSWTKNVEWYGVLMSTFSLLVAAAFGSVFLAATEGQRGHSRKIAIVGTVAVLTGTLLTMQYTSIGIMLTLAGTLLALCGPPIRSSRAPIEWAKVLAGSALIVLGFMCRFESGALGLMLALPVTAITLSRRTAGHAMLKRAGITVLVTGPLLLGNAWVDQRAYAEQGWVDGVRYFRAIRPFVDYRLHYRLCEVEECAQSSGIWSVNDMRLLNSFIYADPEVFSEANVTVGSTRLFPDGTSGLTRIAVLLRPYGLDLGSIATDRAHLDISAGRLDQLENGPDGKRDDRVAAMVRDAFLATVAVARLLKNTLWHPGMVGHPEFGLFCFMLALTLQVATRRRRMEILGYVVWTGLLLTAIGLLANFPKPWVLRPFWLGSSAALLAVALPAIPLQTHLPKLRRVVATVLIGLSLYLIFTGTRGASRTIEFERIREEFLAKHQPTDELLVTSLASFPIESLWRPFGGNASLHAHRWLLLAWTSGTPVQAMQLRNTGISRPLVAAACGTRAIFLGGERHTRLVETFAREHSGVSCKLSPTARVGRAALWRGKRID